MKKKKIVTVIIIVVALIVLLTPIRINLKDGGSIRYKALTYEVKKIHQLSDDVDGEKPYIEGYEVKIFGITIYRETDE